MAPQLNQSSPITWRDFLNHSGKNALTLWYPDDLYIIRSVFSSLCCVCGILFNTFIVLAIVPNRRLRSVRNIFLAHLGVVGLVLSSTIVLTSSVSMFRGTWLGGQVLCNIYAYAFSVLLLLSVWIITALSWDKYQTIVNPLHHSQSTTFLRMTITFSIFWVAGFSLAIPPLLGGNIFVLHPAMSICTVHFSNTSGQWYSVCFLMVGVFIPLFVLTYCYAHIFKIARSQSSKIAASMVKMVSVIQAPITTTPPRSISIKGKRAIGTIMHIVGAFILTYIPFALVVTVEIISGSYTSEIVSVVSASMILAAPTINGAIYGLRNRILRESFMAFMRKQYKDFVQSELDLEIGQSRRNSLQSPIRRSESTMRMSVLLRRCAQGNRPTPAPTSSGKMLRRTQSVHSKMISTPPSPKSLVPTLVNGAVSPMTVDTSQKSDHALSIPRVHSMPVQYLNDDIPRDLGCL